MTVNMAQNQRVGLLIGFIGCCCTEAVGPPPSFPIGIAIK